MLARPTGCMDSRVGITHLLDVVITESPAVLELLTSENQSLLVRWDALLILDL